MKNLLSLASFSRAFLALRLPLIFLLGFSSQAIASSTGAPAPEGTLSNIGSLFALAVVMVAFATAWMLNHSAPRVRVGGTLLAAASCAAMVGWFVLVLGTGVLENPKPFQAPMDAAKPALMWIEAGIALLAGLGLLALALRQRQGGEILDLPSTNEAARYGQVSRTLHWTTAILFLFMIPTGIFSAMIPEGVWYRLEYNITHKTIGVIILGLTIARLLWNRRSQRPALDGSLKPIERKMAHGAHVLLYVLLIAVPLTGYMMTSLHGYSTYFFAWEIPSFFAESPAYKYWGLFHKYLLQYLIYMILGAHILGALKHHFVDKHKAAIKRMLG